MRLSISSALLLATAGLLAPRVAQACGSSGPDGVSACSLAEHEDAERLAWRVGLGAVATSTALHLSNGLHADESRLASLASLGYSPSSRLTLEVGAGAGLGGRLVLPDGTHDFSAGPAFAIGASWHVVEGRPFVILSSFLSFVASTTRLDGAGPSIGYEAFDLRLGGIIGTTLWNTLSPYALARAFGGPVFWHYQGAAVTGTDTHHYQVGAGTAVALGRRVDVYVEGVPLGEQAVSVGVGVAF